MPCCSCASHACKFHIAAGLLLAYINKTTWRVDGAGFRTYICVPSMHSAVSESLHKQGELHGGWVGQVSKPVTVPSMHAAFSETIQGEAFSVTRPFKNHAQNITNICIHNGYL